jgi:hypothetical protein
MERAQCLGPDADLLGHAFGELSQDASPDLERGATSGRNMELAVPERTRSQPG